MNQGRRLKGVIGSLATEMNGRQCPQLIIDKRQKTFYSTAIAFIDSAKKAGDFSGKS